MTLLEQFKGRIKLAEDVYAKEHKGENLSESKKLVIARVLRNTSDYLTESFGPTNGTQLANIGTFKKFCLDMTNLSLPNLIAHELVLVKAMPSITGFMKRK